MTTRYALQANVRVHETAYEYRDGAVQYAVDEDADEEYRAVVASSYRTTDGEDRLRFEVDGIRLTPTWTQRLRERLTSYEYEPEQEWEQVRRVTAQVEAAIDEVREVESRHESCEEYRGK